MRRKYKDSKPNKAQEIDILSFRNLFAELDAVVPSAVVSAIFREFDTRKCGGLSFRDVCLGLVTTCISSWDIRARFLFKVFDADGDNVLKEADIRNLLLCIISAVRKSVTGGDHSVMFPFMVSTEIPIAASVANDIFLERIQSCVTAIQSEVVSAANDDRISFDESCYCGHVPTTEEANWVDYEISLLFSDQKKFIDFQTDFLPWSCRNCHYLYKFLELLEIVPSPAKEKRICLNILRKSFPAIPGSTWCVVSYKWVQLWKSYVHWSETDSADTMWMSHTLQNAFAPDNQVVIGEIFHAVSTMDAMSCTSTIIQQRMSERPMAINNSDLEGELKGALRGNLVEFHDYVLVPDEMWRYLSDWYGGGPAFPRKIIIPRRRACSSLGCSPVGYSSYTVDLYPPLISVVLCGENGLPVKHFTKRFFVSKSDSCQDLLQQLVRRMGENAPRQARLWHKQNGERWQLVDSSDSCPVEEYVDSVSTEAGTFMLEIARGAGSWPRDALAQSPMGDVSEELQVGDRVDALVASTPRGWRKATIVDVFDDKSVKVHFDGEQYIHDAWLSCDSDEIAPLGTHTVSGFKVKKISRKLTGTTDLAKKQRDEPIGLENIGNTCFMNSSLQCLSHTPMLREYFLTREFEKHVRSTAKMAGEFASLLFNMCTSQKRFIAPKSFKRALDKYAPSFSGYEHQDAHELLAVLLDGLHEDLNRGAVASTANTTATAPTPDGPSTPVAMIPQFLRTTSSGEDEWRKHRYHNTSVISDLFDGQQRIVTECKSCGHQCENFEAFRYLMLPVPVTDTRNIAVDLVVSGTGEMVRLTATVHRGALMQAVVSSLASRYSGLAVQYGLEWDSGGIVLVEVYMSRIHRFIDMMMPVCDFRSDDTIMAFQVESNKVNESVPEMTSWTYAQIVHRKDVVSKRQRRTVTRKEVFGTPIVVSVNQNWSNEQLHRVLRERLGIQRNCPFVVRVTTPDGACSCTACGRISCEGCVIHPTDSKTLVSCYSGGSPWLYLAVDWQSPAAYRENQETMLLPQNTDADKGNIGKSKSTSLYDCLDSYTASEFLGGDNRWHCEKCNQLSDAVRRTSFWVTPDVLVVLLKRFQFSPTCGFEKISVPVKFPESELVIKSSVYDLYGVVNHFGSLSSGHYTALCREEATSRWFIYNDHQVTLVGADQLQKELNSCAKSCYVLFYKRRTTRPANIINYYGLNE